MEGIVCTQCNYWLTDASTTCPDCGTALVFEGEGKNVIDRMQPNCLIHRYEGSDLLEPAVLIKEGKTNMKVATRLKEYAKPVVVPKYKVFAFDQSILSSIQALRNERTATIKRYDQLIGSHWQRLKTYK
jgi:RNA polymerase subunit RPABC4/transcription elongation factor Spt4